MHARGDEVLHAHVEDPPPSVSERRGDLSPAIDSVVARGMAKDPDDRYGSCTGLIAAARTALARAHGPAGGGGGKALGRGHAGLQPGAPAGDRGKRAGHRDREVEDEFLIGRQEEGAGTLGEDIEISRCHARIRRTPPHGCVIEDLGSTNGTFVNERRITGPEPLSVGDRVRVGETTLVVQFSADPTPTPTEAPVVEPPAVEPAAVEPPGRPRPRSSSPRLSRVRRLRPRLPAPSPRLRRLPFGSRSPPRPAGGLDPFR